MTQIKLVALDLDDTALLPGGKLGQRTRYAMEAAAAAGIEVVVASGRSFPTLPEEIYEIPGLRYAITSNGASVNRMPDGERLMARCLEARDVELLLCMAEEYGYPIEVFVKGVPYSTRECVEEPVSAGFPLSSVPYIRRTRKPVEDIFTFARAHAGELDSLDFICGAPERRELAQKLLQGKTDGIYITSSMPHLLEISRVGGGKGSGLEWISRFCGVLREETAACGNADNDIDMIRFAGIGTAVANASPACLAAADRVIGSNEEEGVALFLEEIVKMQERAQRKEVRGWTKQKSCRETEKS